MISFYVCFSFTGLVMMDYSNLVVYSQFCSQEILAVMVQNLPKTKFGSCQFGLGQSKQGYINLDQIQTLSEQGCEQYMKVGHDQMVIELGTCDSSHIQEYRVARGTQYAILFSDDWEPPASSSMDVRVARTSSLDRGDGGQP